MVYAPELGYVQAPGTVEWNSEAHGTSVWSADGLRRASPLRSARPRVLLVGERCLPADDVTRVKLVVYVSTGPQLACLTYRVGYLVEVAKQAPPATAGEGTTAEPPPPLFFFR